MLDAGPMLAAMLAVGAPPTAPPYDDQIDREPGLVGEGDRSDGGEARLRARLGDAEPERTPQEDRAVADAEEGSLGDLTDPELVDVEQTLDPEDWPRRLGPAKISIGRGGDRLSLGFAVQLRGSLEQRSDDSVGALDGGVELRRLRTSLGSRFLQGKVRSAVQVNLTPSSPELLDAWFMYVPIQQLAVRVGQFKVPYTRYRLQSFAALSLTDWAPTTAMFGAERQIGLELLNPAPGQSTWEYGVGVFTGDNARATHAVGLTETYGGVPTNRSSFQGLEAPARIHPEFIARVAKDFGGIDTATSTDYVGGPLRSSVGLSAAWDARAKHREDLSGRLAIEWLAKLRHAYVNVVGHAGWFDRARDAGPWGAMAEVGYRFTRYWEISGRYDGIWLGKRLRNDAAAFAQSAKAAGDREVTSRDGFALVGRLRSRHELATALSYYIIGHSLKAQLEAAWRAAETDFGRRQMAEARLQLQFQF